MQQGAYDEYKTNEGNFAGACKDFKIDAALEVKMIQVFVNLISGLLLAALVWRNGRARLPNNSKAVRYFKIAGALLLGAQVAIYAFILPQLKAKNIYRIGPRVVVALFFLLSSFLIFTFFY